MSSSTPSSASYEPTRRGLPVAAAPLLELQNLSTHYVSAQGTRVVRAVDDVSLRIHAGETLGIVGESGSGKSITLRSVLGIVPEPGRVIEGQVLWRGRDLLTLPPRELTAFLRSPVPHLVIEAQLPQSKPGKPKIQVLEQVTALAREAAAYLETLIPK